MKELIEQLASHHTLDASSMERLLVQAAHDTDTLNHLRHTAVRTAQEQFGRGIYVRGLIELSSYCFRDCLYCGLRRSNLTAERYRLTQEDILTCCDEGYHLGFRTFVLQGGEDATHTDEWLVPLVAEIRKRYPEAAITLSLGERREASYQQLHQAGANRYLLRHEAANEALYTSLHPHGRGLSHRLMCTQSLQRLGYQVGLGMIHTVGCVQEGTQCIDSILHFNKLFCRNRIIYNNKMSCLHIEFIFQSIKSNHRIKIFR